MPLSREISLEVLGLSSVATTEEILLRYKLLAIEWYPAKHNHSQYSLEVFRNISRAAFSLLYTKKSSVIPNFDVAQMYQFFQNVFFGVSKDNELSCECEYESDDYSIDEDSPEAVFEDLQAACKASELLMEEEQEKAKAARKKAKKKRRKERKKLEKIGNGTTTQESKTKSPESKEKTLEKEVSKCSDTEEDLDPSSAFVYSIAKKHKTQIPGLQPSTDVIAIHHHNHYMPDFVMDEEDPETTILQSRQIALEGNMKANEGKYQEAIELFTESIELDPSDHRFYGNRSYCYDRLGQFEKALKDADKSIKLCPAWPKGFFRKGRALLGLRRFASAEKYFIEVLKLDNDCEDALAELRKAKLLQIMEQGFSKEIAEAALSRHGSVSEALDHLITCGVTPTKVKDDLDIFISDDDEVENTVKVPRKIKPPSQPYDIKQDPKNPEGHNSLWIGNVQNDVTEKQLTKMFAKHGELISVKIMPEKFCAFVNYKNKASPGKAMAAYQGYELSGYNLVIRFPNLPGETATVTTVKKPNPVVQDLKKQGPINGNECYFWRTTGCVYGKACRYQHVKEHKGIDKKDWQVP